MGSDLLMQTIEKRIEQITDKEDFLTFLNELIFDNRNHPKEWENSTVDLYLEAMLSWIEDYSVSAFNDVDWNNINYAVLAKILYMGKLYE